MSVDFFSTSDPAAEYLRVYREWRDDYGLGDPCIQELQAAILVEIDCESHGVAQRDRLEMLLRLIEREQAARWGRAA